MCLRQGSPEKLDIRVSLSKVVPLLGCYQNQDNFSNITSPFGLNRVIIVGTEHSELVS